jgi:hypothetical protein
MPAYKTKGTHVLQARIWVDERLGAGMFNKLAAESGDAWPTVLLPASWYDVEPLVKLLTIVSARTRISLENITTEITARNARNDLTSVYRAFLRVAGPHLTMNATAKLWSTYVAFGEAKKIQNDPGFYLAECRGIPRHLLSWACGAWKGFVPTAIEVSGGKRCVSEIVFRRREPDSDLWMIQFSVKYS